MRRERNLKRKIRSTAVACDNCGREGQLVTGQEVAVTHSRFEWRWECDDDDACEVRMHTLCMCNKAYWHPRHNINHPEFTHTFDSESALSKSIRESKEASANREQLGAAIEKIVRDNTISFRCLRHNEFNSECSTCVIAREANLTKIKTKPDSYSTVEFPNGLQLLLPSRYENGIFQIRIQFGGLNIWLNPPEHSITIIS